MSFDEKTNQNLAEPLDPAFVSERKQAGQTLSYIEGHHANRELNRIFGYGGWSRRTLRNEIVNVKEYDGSYGPMTEVVAQAVVEVSVLGSTGQWITRSGTGVGNGTTKSEKTLVAAYEGALKEAETDAFKRACVTFGDQFGLALYDKTQKRVVAPEPVPMTELHGTDLEKQINAAKSESELRRISGEMSNQDRVSYRPLVLARVKGLRAAAEKAKG